MKRKLLYCFVSAAMLVGCSRVAAPEDFPKIYPSHVKILKDGKPLENIQVVLIPAGRSLSYIVGGKTDKNGVAEIRTIRGTYEKSGAPEGSYRVKLDESIPVDMPPLGDDSTAKQQRDWDSEYARKIDAARKIPTILCDTVETPLTLSVEAPGATVEFDVERFRVP